ncbi:MAG: SMP-30/gluconolactonase/LRE family protein [Myxococcales bacterium]
MLRRLSLCACLLIACRRTPRPPRPQLTLSLLAGQVGGIGGADGPGESARFSFPGGLAWNGAAHVYVADTLNDTLRTVDLATGETRTVAGLAGAPGSRDGAGPSARLREPAGLAWDGAGQLFIADRGNRTVRRFDAASGRLTTLLRLPNSEALAGLAFAHGRLLAADERAAVVWSLDLAGGAATVLVGKIDHPGEVDGPAPAARLDAPAALAWDGGPALYIADAGGRSVRRFDLAAGRLTTLSAAAARWGQPSGLALDGLGHLFVADALEETVRALDLASGALAPLAGLPGVPGADDGVGPQTRLAGPTALAFAGAGRLVVADSSSVRQLDLPDGRLASLAGRVARPGSASGTGATASFRVPRGLAADGRGALYVADSANGVIRRVDRSGMVQTLPFRLQRPVAVAAADAVLYVADAWAHAVVTIDLARGTAVRLAGGRRGGEDGTGSSASFCGPVALALDGRGHLYVADHPYQDESGEDDEEVGAGDADEERPGCGAIRRLDLASASVVTVAGSASREGEEDGRAGAARFRAPMALAWTGDALAVADTEGPTIRRLDPMDGRVTTLAGLSGEPGGGDGRGGGARLEAPEGLAFDGRAGLWVADGSTLRRFDLVSGRLTTVLGRDDQAGLELGAGGLLNHPIGLALFEGRIWISDAAENALLAAGPL